MRNFGSPSCFSARTLPRKLPGLRARLFYSVERLLQSAPYSLSKAHSAASSVHVQCVYMGRVLFHVGESRMIPQESLTRVRGEK